MQRQVLRSFLLVAVPAAVVAAVVAACWGGEPGDAVPVCIEVEPGQVEPSALPPRRWFTERLKEWDPRREGVSDVAYSPDGKLIAAGGYDGVVEIRDAQTGQLRWRFTGHGDPSVVLDGALAVAFSPDAKTLAACSYTKIHLWDVTTGKAIRTFGDTFLYQSVRFSPDGRTLLALCDKIQIWDVASGTRLRVFGKELFSKVDEIVLSPDGKTVAVDAPQNGVCLYDTTTGKPTVLLRGHRAPLSVAAFSPDGKKLAGVDSLGWVVLLDLDDYSATRVHQGHVSPLAFSPDGRTLAVHDDDHVHWYDVQTGMKAGTCFDRFSPGVSGISFAPDGRRFVVFTAGKIVVWDLIAGQEERTLLRTPTPPKVFTTSANGKLLATAGVDRIIRVWRADTGARVREFAASEYEIQSLSFSSDGRRLVSAGSTSEGKGVCLWDVATGKAATATLPEELQKGHFAAYVPGQDVIAWSDGSTVSFLHGDATAGPPATEPFRGEQLKFSRDGKFLATHDDGRVRIYDMSVRRLVTEFATRASDMEFSPDATLLATAGGRVKLWETETGELRETLVGSTYSGVYLAFSLDGKWLVSGGWHGPIDLWHLPSRQLRATLYGHAHGVSALAMLADGRRFVTAGRDGLVKLWDLPRLLATMAEPTRELKKPLTAGVPRHRMLFVDRLDVTGIDFSPDSRWMAISGHDGISVRDLALSEWTRNFSTRDKANCVAFAPQGNLLAGGYGDVRGDVCGVVRLWDAADGRLVRSFNTDFASVEEVAFTNDGKKLAVAAGTHDGVMFGEVSLWDVASGRPLKRLPLKTWRPYCLDLSPDGKLLAFGGNDSTVYLWDLAAEKIVDKIELDGGVNRVAFSPDGRLLIAITWFSRHGKTIVWDVANGKPSSLLSNFDEAIDAFAFSDDGRLLAITGHDKQLHYSLQFLEIATGTVVRKVDLESLADVVAFSPDGRTLATSKHSGMLLWNLPDLMDLVLRDAERITDEGVEMLQQKLPECRIHR